VCGGVQLFCDLVKTTLENKPLDRRELFCQMGAFEDKKEREVLTASRLIF
jgi:imidazolonepropionase-like amidohydrolase